MYNIDESPIAYDSLSTHVYRSPNVGLSVRRPYRPVHVITRVPSDGPSAYHSPARRLETAVVILGHGRVGGQVQAGRQQSNDDAVAVTRTHVVCSLTGRRRDAGCRLLDAALRFISRHVDNTSVCATAALRHRRARLHVHSAPASGVAAVVGVSYNQRRAALIE